MRRARWLIMLTPALVLSVVVLAACGTSSATPATEQTQDVESRDDATQTSDAGRVTVKVTWTGAASGIAFRVIMDTHSVDLDGYDLQQLAVLRTDQGLESQPSGWDAPKGGHHREGTLTFPATTADGTPLIGPSTGTIELLIRDVAGVPERSFRWQP